MLRIRTLALSLCLVVGIAASANATSITYTVDARSGSISGNAVTHVAIFEMGGGFMNIDFGFSLNPTGQTTLTHDVVGFVPTTSLILGLDVPSPGGDPKTHLFFFTNPEFANAGNGVRFSVMFPNTRYPDVAVNLLAAEGGDAASLTWLQNFFAGDGAAASFAPGGPTTPIEFSVGVVPTPEPSTMVLFGLGAAMTAALRLRRAKR